MFEDTLKAKDKRGSTPWVKLYTKQDRVTRAARDLVKFHISSPKEDRSGNRLTKFLTPTTTKSMPTGDLPIQLPLTLDMKSEYVRKEWWMSNSATTVVPDESSKTPTIDLTKSSASGQTPKSTQRIPSDECEDDPGDDPGDNPENIIPIFVSSAPLGLDDNLFSKDLFQSEKRRGDVHTLYQEILKVLSIWPKEDSPTNLYCLARFRSRMLSEWWAELEPKENIVEQALRLSPALDICTLAWLCNGPIGGQEVRNLSGDYYTWKIIISSEFLDESQRLERFLLLLQFGARIGKSLSGWSGIGEGRILSLYIQNCRPATYPVIIKEICRRFNRIRDLEHVAKSTKDYLTINAVKDLRWINEALPGLWNQFMDHSADIRDSGATHERTPLVQNSPLPPGWKKHTSTQRKGVKREWFEDEYTHSITLDEPKVSLISLRQVKIGFLDPKMGSSCYLDLAPYIMPGMDIQSNSGLDQDATNRFPYYDDDWFANEWRVIPAQEDVLKDLREITSFSIRIPELGIGDFLVGAVEWGIEGLNIIFKPIWMIIQIVFAIVFVVLAFCICVALLFGLVWVLMPALLLVGNCLFIFTIFMVCFIWTTFDSSGRRDDDKANVFAFISITTSLALGIALLVWEIRNPCPGGDKGTLKNGDECTVCQMFIWNYLSCTPLKDGSSGG